MFPLVQPNPVFIEFTPTLDTAIYASGDVLFATPRELTVLQGAAKLATLSQLVVIDSAFQNKALDLYFFDTKPAATFVANAAYAPTAADQANLLHMVAVSAGTAFAAVSQQTVNPLPGQYVFKPKPGKFSIWMVAVSKGTGTYLASSLKFRFLFTN